MNQADKNRERFADLYAEIINPLQQAFNARVLYAENETGSVGQLHHFRTGDSLKESK